MQVFLNSLFAFQATGFYVLSLIFLIFLFIFLENEREGALFWSTLGYTLITSYSTGFSATFGYISTHKFIIMNWALAYVLIGISWAFCKVYFKGRRYRTDVRELKKTFIFDVNNRVYDKEEQFKKHIYEGIKSKYTRNTAIFVTEGASKSSIIMWMSYWPFSAFWTLLDDPIKHFFVLIYNCIGKFYHKIHIKAVGLNLPE